MHFSFAPDTPKEEVFASVKQHLDEVGIRTASVDADRPWGGFYVIDSSSESTFIEQYYKGYDLAAIRKFGGALMPKILIAAPDGILSWQFHYRRAEIWSCVDGPVGYNRSMDDNQGEINLLQPGEVVQYQPLERHRLRGVGTWGIVAEFWQHTDPDHLSDEDDIVRLDDAYGRAA